MAKQKTKRAARSPEEKKQASDYGKKWWKENDVRIAEMHARQQDIEKRLDRGHVHELQEAGLSIISGHNPDTWWSGPGMNREKKIERLADKILDALKNGRPIDTAKIQRQIDAIISPKKTTQPAPRNTGDQQ